ncbi:PQQ-binding-like beta-propeller repeat protein [Streptomyces sp. NPDC047928]|uniref:outer membrane protein assembly factor BamB family protein n=1 Tax=unclassified Streptomyces TaxID=2593676 RepID=UPI00371C7F4A
MTSRIDRILGDRPFAEAGDPVITVPDERRGLLAVAGAHEFDRAAPVGVFGTGDLGCRALLRSRYPVHAMAFHPTLPLLVVGTGRYDGGYFFEGELLLLDLVTGTATSLIEDGLGRQILGLEWLDERRLRVLAAPPDDWRDNDAHAEGHVAHVLRPDWSAVPPRSIEDRELAGPRVPAPRPDGRAEARRTLSALSADWDPRRHVRSVRVLSDGRILATLDGVGLECWDPTGKRLWTVPDDRGGRDIAIATDEQSAWAGLVRPLGEESPQSVVRLSLQDGRRLDHVQPSAPVSVVGCADGRPAFAPAGHNGGRSRLRIRRGSRVYFQATVSREGERGSDRREAWLAAVDLDPVPAAERPREPEEAEGRRLFPYSWAPDETHFAGPGAEAADGSLVHAGSVYHGHGLQPGGSFVVRREAATGQPRWVFRTDRVATDLDCDTETAYVAYDDGEVVALDLRDGTVRWRRPLTVAGVLVVPVALTVAGPKRLLIGTDDGRLLDCSTG